MYALDNVRIVSRPQIDISDIPAHIVTLHAKHIEAEHAMKNDPWSNTASQKRTATMRFNKLCDAIEAAGMDVPNTLVRLTNA